MFGVGGFKKFQKGLRIHALFNSAKELKVGDRVKLAGVEVGQVEKISLTESEGGVKVKVSMRIDADAPVKTDTVAKIDFAGLMGQNFVSLDRASTKGLPAQNDTILSTVEQADLSAIMAKLDNVATGVESQALNLPDKGFETLAGLLVDTRLKVELGVRCRVCLHRRASSP